MDQHVIRPVRADEWEKVKELRIDALNDPAAPVAFLDTAEQAEARSDEFWQDRAQGASHGRHARQFVAEAGDGAWDGSVTVLVEESGTVDFFERPIEQTQGHLVGVFVRPQWRGTGLTEGLFAAALEWAWSLEGPALERVRLFVHDGNARAGAFYRRFGFEASGHVVPVPGDPSAKELEYVFRRP
ncbi:GNAT family N-acetyltransferase [Streptomyces sp. ISL-86]|uniref:GNAT family N-acetyltransferase n=1 Tax=unclassified Streptomyces TaxID=2593676 RepID=UPI001BE51973|nr:GNAT family N-acetyltransferase [Streptomyces sp. ISL-86]MBT2405295.1 GNAT family N-acetyltransferase [Streptomyces sp. ISL-21]MBT2460064.1 GNAT family N-acetyltransferase [Streptomyces sp. ISL-86]MBT2613762.1 GNAT family N-acetyltransferase [Streptomyces sp. ISL-87]